MNQPKKIEWIRLDNASKFFPATCSDRDPKVFRLACELFEAVDPNTLQKALDITIERFPFYRSILRKGIFWYYFEASDIRPVVEKEEYPICAPIYLNGVKGLLFRVFYHNSRINLEVFHALSDGTGALWFLKTLVFHYLLLRHRDEFPDKHPTLDDNASISEKMDDSFVRHYPGRDFHPIKQRDGSNGTYKNAYQIRGIKLDENRTRVIEGSMSARSVLNEAHRYGATLTVFIASLLICSIYKEMPARKKTMPIVLTVPVNLRQFFESETARNFFCTMKIGYCFNNGSFDLEDVIKSVSESFRKELTEENMNRQLNYFMALERSMFTRVIPVPLKDFSLKLADSFVDRGITSGLTNIGRITMPPELNSYIRQFIVTPNVKRPQAAICSFGDRLVVNFASPYKGSEIQRNFFRYLSEMGIEIDITSNV